MLDFLLIICLFFAVVFVLVSVVLPNSIYLRCLLYMLDYFFFFPPKDTQKHQMQFSGIVFHVLLRLFYSQSCFIDLFQFGFPWF